MTRRWSETRLHDGSENPPVTEGRVRFDWTDDYGVDAKTTGWFGAMAYQIELPPEPPAERWTIKNKATGYINSEFTRSPDRAEIFRQMQPWPDDWKVVRFVEARAMIAENREALWADRAKTADAEVARLRDELFKAANRIEWCAGLLPTDTSRDQASGWAEEARAALQEKPE